MITIEEIHLTRGPNVEWLKALPAPWSSYQPATILGELAELAPDVWRIYARHCLSDTVVYGNGKCSFGITLRDGRWRFRFCDGPDTEFLHRKTLEDALSRVGANGDS